MLANFCDMAGFEGLVHESWLPALEPHANSLSAIGDFLRQEISAGRGYSPAPQQIFAAYQIPLDSVRVLLVGQDPYPTPGHAMGLAFSVEANVKPLPKSLKNIFEELHTDTGCPRPTSGDLSAWQKAGVMLLNRALTVRVGDAGSHRDIGWQHITNATVLALVERRLPLVAILWGNDAQTLQPLLGNTPCISSVHPSPLSAHRGFFGSKPFSRANALLVQQQSEPIDWCIT